MIPDIARATPCDICGLSSVVLVNGYGSCAAHLEYVFLRAIRLQLFLRGVPEAERPEMETAMVANLRDAWRSGRWSAFAFDIDQEE